MIRVPGHRVRRPVYARGFSLIELMVVVAIVAILAAIAYPSYQDSVRKSRRGQVKADMADIAQQLERYHTVNNTYTGFWNSRFGAGATVASPATGGVAAYRIGIGASEAANSFTLTATPQGNQTEDTRCASLTLNQAGVKTKTGTASSLSECW